MAKYKRMIVLAKSAKGGNYCVAGIDVDTNKWIRPVSKNPDLQEAVEPKYVEYSSGNEIQFFDAVRIPVDTAHTANNFVQPENFYFDEKLRWEKIGETNLEKIIDWHGFDERNFIFYDRERKVSPNCIAEQSLKESLLLLKVKNLFVRVEDYERKRYLVDFKYNGQKYERFSLGDIETRKIFEKLPGGYYSLCEEGFVVFSLTNPFRYDGMCYKMVAKIFADNFRINKF